MGKITSNVLLIPLNYIDTIFLRIENKIIKNKSLKITNNPSKSKEKQLIQINPLKLTEVSANNKNRFKDKLKQLLCKGY